MDFLDRVLALPSSSRIRNFSLKCRKCVGPTHYALVNRCLCYVLKRGVLDLKLNIKVEKGCPLPFEIFTCKTVAKLKLGSGFGTDLLPKNALLPSLKTLILDSVKFYDRCGCEFQKLLSACPVLVELVMRNLEWSRGVSSPNLERLTINQRYLVEHNLDTPSLIYLDYNAYVPELYPIVNLDSLVEAKLDLVFTITSDPTI